MFFRDIKLVLEQYLNGESSIEEIQKIVDDLTIETYLPIIKKYAAIGIFNKRLAELISDMDKTTNEDIVAYYITYDVEKAFIILDSYAGIYSSFDERTANNYDLIISSGFYRMILSKCREDVNIFENICNRNCGINNVWIMNQLNEIFCSSTNVANVEKIADIINNQINKDTLDKMNAIQLLTNPTLNAIVNNLQKETADKVMNRE